MIAKCPNCGIEQCWVKSDPRPRCPKCGWPTLYERPRVVVQPKEKPVDEPLLDSDELVVPKQRRKRYRDPYMSESEK